MLPDAASSAAIALAHLRFVTIAHGEQHLFGEIQVAAFLAVILEDVRLDDRVDRAALFAETAEDALGQVDVVARRAAGVVVALLPTRS